MEPDERSTLRRLLQLMSSISLCAVLLSCDGGAPAPKSLPAEPGVSLELAEHRAAVLSDIRYRLELEVPPELESEIRARTTIRFELSDASLPLQLDFRESFDKIQSLRLNGRSTSYTFQHEHIVLPVSELKVGANEVEIEHIAGNGSLNRNPDYLYTLFVPDRARTAFPLFDQPNLKAKYELVLTLPSDWVAIANGAVVSVEASDGRNIHRFAESDLISSYLFSFVAGRFEVVTRTLNGREMTMLHRETDPDKVARNVDDVFELHAAALRWLEDFTGIPYPFEKFDFALIPSFQYGGMEHVGAIQYRASTLFLEEAPSASALLGRAGLIAHETAHMWFGNLVTMDWFNDVWTKEVFANFMAAKIVNPSFPEIDHDLNFLVRHYSSAYGVDRSEGANPIRQDLANLSEAGQLYGAIIYNKAPIMMRQLEVLLGEQAFREGIQEYLKTFSFGNATWPELIRILDSRTDQDLAVWSEVWVQTSGRPTFEVGQGDSGTVVLSQKDPSGGGRLWPQRFSVRGGPGGAESSVLSASVETELSIPVGSLDRALFNGNGFGYGLFPVQPALLESWSSWSPVERGSLLVHLYENGLEKRGVELEAYFDALMEILAKEQDQLLLSLAIDQTTRLYHSFLSEASAAERRSKLEEVLWAGTQNQGDESRTKLFFTAYASLGSSPEALDKIYRVWNTSATLGGLKLSENDTIDLAETLAVRLPGKAQKIVEAQLARIENPDNRRRFEFIAPSLSAEPSVRDEFFACLADEKNRQTESWVLDALANLHHPSRIGHSEKYIQRSLELLQEIQITGDIFFPKRWLDQTLQNHRSPAASQTVREFLEQRPDYNAQLRMKILQAADLLFRASS